VTIFGLGSSSNEAKINWFKINKDRIYECDKDLINEANTDNKFEFINAC